MPVHVNVFAVSGTEYLFAYLIQVACFIDMATKTVLP